MNTPAQLKNGLRPKRVRNTLTLLACAALACVQLAHADSSSMVDPPGLGLPGLGTAGLTPRLAPSATAVVTLPPIREAWLGDAERALQSCPQAPVLSELSLEDALELALCHSSKVRSAWLDVQIQASNMGEAQAGYYPTASYSISRVDERTRTQESLFSPGGVAKVSAQNEYGAINWRLLDYGERSGNRSAATQQHVAALASYEATLQDLRRNVIAAYFDASVARWAWLTRQSSESLSLRALDVTKRRQLNGAASLSDTARASASYANNALERSRSKSAYDRALLNLAQTMGLQGYNGPVEPAKPGVEACSSGFNTVSTSQPCMGDLLSYLDETGDAAGVLASMAQDASRIRQHLRDTHPALVSLRAQASASRHKAASIRGQLFPKLDLVANYYKNGSLATGLTDNDSTRTVAGVTLTVPLFDGFAGQYKMKGILRQAEKSEAELQGVEAQLLNDWSRLHSELANALANLQSSAHLAEVAQTSIASSKRRLARGEADVLELMSAQDQLLNARQERYRAVSEWHSARLQLLVMAGGQ